LADDLEYTLIYTDWGWLGAARSPRGLVSLALPHSTAEGAMSALGMPIGAECCGVGFAEFEKKLRDYLAGKQVAFDEILDLVAATNFQRQVWLAAREIPYGETRSYAWVATRLGNPKACRAVGQALGKNPLPIVIPCHRVLSSGGTLGGFSGGIDTKRRLLALEGMPCPGF